MVGLSEGGTGGFKKTLFVIISQWKTSELECLFKKATGLKACNFIKKSPQQDLLENSELCRMDNFIEQSQKRNSCLITSTSILDKEV